MYSVCANIHDVGIVSVPFQIEGPDDNLKGLKPDLPLPSFHIDPQEILNAAAVSDLLVQPWQPHGQRTASAGCGDDFELEEPVHTYEHKRLIVLQTLSKGFGFAGIRLGVAFGDPKLIQVLNNVKAPYNISNLTSDVARKAFSNLDELRKNVNVIQEIKELQKLSYVRRIYALGGCGAVAVSPLVMAPLEDAAQLSLQFAVNDEHVRFLRRRLPV
ncbi:hypothetical protein PF007_g13656 [Phytophthora fragariae]|uniref:histidinol-phosphate transaminase n=1 Tax=Phytophthora fragariae TaxID=53985 RepID=A0A6A3ETR7_9STRA|nr:hypothetical protein PF009_g14107 [Phytophthora fragariae]KAE9105579.1 hypothetical protein PF007_g13656 [Phytophthora fragariae]KAE9142776.1 hypothetical protein PF006_g12146 [Phytophthora fragariae]